MSKHAWTSYGYGIDFDIAYPETSKELAFLTNHKKTFKKVAPTFYEDATIYLAEGIEPEDAEMNFQDFIDTYEDNYGYCGFEPLLRDIMSEETGLNLEILKCDEPAVVALPSCYPWQLSDKEKALTEESCREIFEKYTSELGMSDECIGEHDVDYYS